MQTSIATLTNRRRILCWKGWQMQDISVRGIYCLIMAVEKEANVPAQTVAIDEEPFDSKISDTTRTTYG